MGKMNFDVSHSLPKPEARQRIEQLLKYWKDKYNVQSTWAGDGAKLSGKVMGINLDAHFTITDGAIKGEGTDPGMLLRGKAKDYLQKKFTTVLDPTKSLADVGKALA